MSPQAYRGIRGASNFESCPTTNRVNRRALLAVMTLGEELPGVPGMTESGFATTYRRPYRTEDVRRLEADAALLWCTTVERGRGWLGLSCWNPGRSYGP